MKACKKPCPECPFRRTSMPGYLGEASHDPKGFVGQHWHSATPLPCHMTVDWEDDNTQGRAERAPLCAGLLIMAKNCAKSFLHPEVEAARKNVERDTVEFFGWMHEFVDHHSEAPT